MNILLTGASRGIGKAAPTHSPPPGTGARHFHPGGDGLIAADFADPARRACWAEGARAARRIDVLVNNAGVYEASPTMRRGRVAGRLGAHHAGQPAGRADLCRLAIAHFRRMAAGGSSMSRAAPAIAAIRPSTGIMPRPRRR
jgi:3-oxoacyl-[acyl-carrier protein] reductase